MPSLVLSECLIVIQCSALVAYSEIRWVRGNRVAPLEGKLRNISRKMFVSSTGPSQTAAFSYRWAAWRRGYLAAGVERAIWRLGPTHGRVDGIELVGGCCGRERMLIDPTSILCIRCVAPSGYLLCYVQLQVLW